MRNYMRYPSDAFFISSVVPGDDIGLMLRIILSRRIILFKIHILAPQCY